MLVGDRYLDVKDVRIVNVGLGFILFLDSGKEVWYDIICDSYTYVTKSDEGMTSVTGWSYMLKSHIIQSHNTEKVIKDSKIDNIIQYNNNMLVL